MNRVIRSIELIERIDYLIRLKATGCPKEFASRLGISKVKLYRTLNVMKVLDAPLEYSSALQSYVYIEMVRFEFGFSKNMP